MRPEVIRIPCSNCGYVIPLIKRQLEMILMSNLRALSVRRFSVPRTWSTIEARTQQHRSFILVIANWGGM